MFAGISIREFARRDGCSDTLVRRAIRQGHLSAFADGMLDPELVGTGWRDANRRSANTANSANSGQRSRIDDASGVRSSLEPQPGDGALLRRQREDDETAAEVAERLVAGGHAPYTQAEAERVKENYLALLRQLEYDQKSGAVVPSAEVLRIVGEEYAKVRTRLISIPAEMAPRLHSLKTVAEVQDALMAGVVEALEALTRDGPAAGL